MNNIIKYLLVFSAGAAVGVAASRRYFKTKYAQLAEEEIASVKEKFLGKQSENEPDPAEERQTYETLVTDLGYSSASVTIEDDTEADIEIIPPESLGEIDEYDTTTFYYLSDGVLVDLQDNIVEDPEKIVGSDFMEHFGEYEDDSVCIRNNDTKFDYEILRDPRSYSNVKKSASPLSDEEE